MTESYDGKARRLVRRLEYHQYEYYEYEKQCYGRSYDNQQEVIMLGTLHFLVAG
jgi:hypothetical protein